MRKALYTLSRCHKKDDELFGSIHASEFAIDTLCGKKIDENWWVLSSPTIFEIRDSIVGNIQRVRKSVTCKKCIKMLDIN